MAWYGCVKRHLFNHDLETSICLIIFQKHCADITNKEHGDVDCLKYLVPYSKCTPFNCRFHVHHCGGTVCLILFLRMAGLPSCVPVTKVILMLYNCSSPLGPRLTCKARWDTTPTWELCHFTLLMPHYNLSRRNFIVFCVQLTNQTVFL